MFARCPGQKGASLARGPSVDLLLRIHDVEEAVIAVVMLLEDLSDGGLVLHQVLAVSEQDDAVLLLTRELQLLLDDGEDLGHLEGAWHEELGVGHVGELGQSALVLGALDDQRELIGVLLSGLSCPLATFVYNKRGK